MPQREHAQALALACPVPQGVELRAQSLAHRRRNRHKFLRELVERVAETVAEVGTREQRPHTAGRAVEPIGQNPPDPIRRLMVDRGALKLAIGLRKSNGTSLRGIAQMPDHAPMDNGRQVHFVCQTRAVLFAA